MNIQIFVNQVFRDSEQNKMYRIVWASSAEGYAYWIELEGKAGLPVKIDLRSVKEKILSGQLVEHPDPFVVPSAPSVRAQKHRDRLWQILSPALQDEPGIFEKHTRAQHLRNIEKDTGMYARQLYPYLRSYWRKGKTPDAFLPAYHRCGGRGKQRLGSSGCIHKSEAGRAPLGKLLDEKDTRNFEKAIRKYYLTRHRPSLQHVYERMLQDSYSVTELDADGNKTLKLLPAGSIPSIHQFRYWYKKNRNCKTELEKRGGRHKFELTGRSITGHSDYGKSGPGAEYQIDATPANIYLVAEHDRSKIIGRPVVYFVIDVFSRMITGMYVGLQDPSWTDAMMALVNAASDKVTYCREYGIEITDAQWPCHHLPSAIVGDRGELIGNKPTNLASMLGIRLDNEPPYRADLKGIVERSFRTLMAETLTSFLPGRVMEDAQERGSRDSRLDAVLTIQEYTKLIINCVLFHNTKHHLDSFEKSDQMLEHPVEAVPLKLWNWGIEHCPGALRVLPEEQVKLALLPMTKATVTAKGVHLKSAYYSSPEMIEELWFEKARTQGSYKVRVSYDPRNMGAIYVWPDQSEIPLKAWAVEGKRTIKGKHLAEMEFEHAQNLRERRESKHDELEAKINLDMRNDEIIRAAQEKAPDTDDLSISEQIGSIRRNRAEEKNTIQEKEAFTTESPSRAASSDKEIIRSTANSYISPDLRMIIQQVRKEITDESLYEEGVLPEADPS